MSIGSVAVSFLCFDRVCRRPVQDVDAVHVARGIELSLSVMEIVVGHTNATERDSYGIPT